MLKVFKKYLCVALATIIVVAHCFSSVHAHGTTTSLETSFMEDFESYQIVEKLSNGYIANGKPQDNDYSDIAIYPNGTASVYEGNAMNNVAVKDAKGNDVFGGLDGWYGYYNGDSAVYNQYNRRLSVGDYTTKTDRETYVNTSHNLKFEPHKTTSAIAVLNRNFVDLSGYSFLSSRVSLSGTTNFGKAGISITQNPENAINSDNTDTVYSALTDVVIFEGNDDGTISIKFNGKTVKSDLAKSDFDTGKKTWYTVEFRLYNQENIQKASLYMINDETGEIVVDTGWVVFNLNEGFEFNSTNIYGFRYFAQSTQGISQPRMLLDDVKFTKNNFTEDFEKYNVNEVLGTIDGNAKRIMNGNFGNINETATYANGVYEGNIAKNNYVYNNLGEKVYGNVPFWQGYLSSVGDQDVYNASNRRCTVGLLGGTSSPDWYAPMNTNKIRLEPKSVNGESHIAYVGMQSSDFSDGTIWETTISFPEATTGVFKLQLTKGYSKTLANGHKNADPANTYDGNSHDAYYDVLTFKDENIYYEDNEVEVGTYGTARKNVYKITYTVDRTNGSPKSSIKIENIGYQATEGTIFESEPSVMNLKDGFDFNSNITGFRYYSATGTCDPSKTVQNKVYIDNISVSKFFGTDVIPTGFRSVCVNDTDGVGTVDCILNLEEAGKKSVICAVYDKVGKQLKYVKCEDKDYVKGDNIISIPVELPSSYSKDKYIVKLFCWNDLKDSVPVTEMYLED